MLTAINTFLNRLGAVLVTLGTVILKGWQKLGEINYQSLAHQSKKVGIIFLIILMSMLVLTVAGIWVGFAGHPYWGVFLLGFGAAGLALLLVFTKIIKSVLGLIIFSVKLGGAITINPSVWLAATALKAGWNIISWPFVMVDKILKTTVSLMLYLAGKNPAEIEKIFISSSKEKTDWPSLKDALKPAEKLVRQAAEKTEELVNNILVFTRTAFAWVTFMGVFILLVKPNTQLPPTPSAGLSLEWSLKGAFLSVVNHHLFLMAVVIVSLYGFTVIGKGLKASLIKKTQPTEINNA